MCLALARVTNDGKVERHFPSAESLTHGLIDTIVSWVYLFSFPDLSCVQKLNIMNDRASTVVIDYKVKVMVGGKDKVTFFIVIAAKE